jgi:hypothetical protein
MADNGGDGGRSGGGSGGGGSLPASARVVPAACNGGTITATHHSAESMRELLLSVLLWIVPGKFVLVQPAPPVDKGNTEHFSAAHHHRVCVRAGFLSEDLREYKHYFRVLLDGVGVSGRSRSRSRTSEEVVWETSELWAERGVPRVSPSPDC